MSALGLVHPQEHHAVSSQFEKCSKEQSHNNQQQHNESNK